MSERMAEYYPFTKHIFVSGYDFSSNYTEQYLYSICLFADTSMVRHCIKSEKYSDEHSKTRSYFDILPLWSVMVTNEQFVNVNRIFCLNILNHNLWFTKWIWDNVERNTAQINHQFHVLFVLAICRNGQVTSIERCDCVWVSV